MISDKRFYGDFDKTLFVSMLMVIAIGLLTIHSATQAKGLSPNESYLFKQAGWVGISLALFLACVCVSYQRFIDLSYLFYCINILLLVFVLFLGHIRLGAQRWFSIGNFTFQPSEFIKLNLILVLASFVGSKKGSMRGFGGFVMPALLLAVPFVLVLIQPDLGTALMLLPIFFAILLVAGADIKYLAGTILAGLACMPFFWHFLRDYQKQRLLVFLNPNIDPLGAGYTIIQSKIAVGSGGIFGKGWLAGTQNQLNFLPERHTDFIFSVIGEEWGLLGALVLILLYFLIVKKAFNIAALTSDMYGKAIATGIAVMMGLQVIINIGMTLGLMPVVGIPLPLVSYGGSNLIMTVIAVGLLINIKMRHSTF